MTCICGHDKHAFTEPQVCCDINCKCEKFIEATPQNPVPAKWELTVKQMKTTKHKIAWLLENIKFLRNYPNKLFVDWFRDKVYDGDPETIRRAKQKLVQDNYSKYGPIDAPLLEAQKQLKQIGIEEWIIND